MVAAYRLVSVTLVDSVVTSCSVAGEHTLTVTSAALAHDRAPCKPSYPKLVDMSLHDGALVTDLKFYHYAPTATKSSSILWCPMRCCSGYAAYPEYELTENPFRHQNSKGRSMRHNLHSTGAII